MRAVAALLEDAAPDRPAALPLDRFDLATREDLDLQKKLLERAQAKLAALEARVAELEARKP